jgi:hypothetical protein
MYIDTSEVTKRFSNKHVSVSVSVYYMHTHMLHTDLALSWTL